MKNIFIFTAVAILLVLCGCSGSSDSSGEATYFQEIRVSSELGMTEGSTRTMITVDDWRQMTRIEENVCNGMILLDESDYQDIVDQIEAIDLINYQPGDDANPGCPYVATSNDKTYTIAYTRNDNKTNSFSTNTPFDGGENRFHTFHDCMSEAVQQVIDFVTSTAEELTPCDTI